MVIVTGLMSAVGYGLYSIFGTFALRKYQPLTVTTYAFLFGAAGAVVLCKPNEIITVISSAPNPAGLVLLLMLTAFVTAVLPYLLYTVGLNHMRARLVITARAGLRFMSMSWKELSSTTA